VHNHNPTNNDQLQLVFLIGFMGTGKTHWGQIWARESGYSFIDLDAAIEQDEKSTVADIFAHKGEEYFRNRESQLLREMKGKEKTIVACGGGTPCFFNNMEWMTANGQTVWLKADPDFIIKNINKQPGSRPLMQGMEEKEMRAFISSRLMEREQFYKQAGIILNAASISPATIGEIIHLKNNDA
jgi:shikimate kinase